MNVSRSLMIVLALATIGFVSKGLAQQPSPAKADPIAKTCPPYVDPSQKLDVNPLVDALDAKKDNHITHDEWIAAGAPESSWKAFTSSSHNDYVTREEFQKGPAPNGIDLNCDGKVTIEEFRAFDKLMSPKMNGSGPPPGGPQGAPGAPPPNPPADAAPPPAPGK